MSAVELVPITGHALLKGRHHEDVWPVEGCRRSGIRFDETTTQADRNLGIVNIVVGFAPLKPDEFVILSLQQIAGQLEAA